MYSVFNTLSEYTYFYLSKNITSYTSLIALKIGGSLHCILKNKHNFTSYQKTMIIILVINQSQLIKTIYFQIYFVYAIKSEWLRLIFGIFRDPLIHCNHSTTKHSQYMTLWSHSFDSKITWSLINHNTNPFSMKTWVVTSEMGPLTRTLDLKLIPFFFFLFHFFLSLQPHNSMYKIWNY